MSATIPAGTLEKFATFGDLLRFLRRRVGITQTELSIAVGYSTSQISRLEQNLRLPDIPTIEARFVEALDLEDDPKAVARLLDLAANVRREDAPAPGLCPYKGLNYFDEADADLFVGREVLTARLVDRVLALTSSESRHKGRFLAIVGASGSGKSSLVRAGLVPALHWNKSSVNWYVRVLTPTARPLESLAASLTRESDSVIATSMLMDDLAADPRSMHLYARRSLHSENGSRLLLLIDQFEELFALCRSEEERAAFIGNLLTAANALDGSTVVLITLRADFYAHCSGYPELREALAQQQEYIGAMNSDELQRAIEEPARRGHWEFEPGLVQMLLHDVGHEPGALPLLSHALLETWERRRGEVMTLSGYAASGGVRGAIAETAEAVFTDQFNRQQQAIARRIFLRLTELGDEAASGDTRRRATYDELILKPEEASSTQTVLKSLADARLITMSEDSAEVAHEALIREWPTLRGWLEDNREGLRLHRNLTEAAQEWLGMERASDMLYHGTRLAQMQEWANAHLDDLNLLEREFVDASVEQREREAQQREAQQLRELEAARKLAETEKSATTRLRLRNRIISAVGAVALLLAVLAAAFGLNSNRNAQKARSNLVLAQNAQATAQAQRTAADQAAAISFSRELAAQAQLNLNIDPERSMLLALAGLDKAHTLEAENALHAAVYNSRLRMTLRGHTGSISSVIYSPDGKWLASAGTDGTARLWDVTTGQQLLSLQQPADVKVVLFSPDGTRLVTAAGDGLVRIWDLASGRQLRAIVVTRPMVPDYFDFSAALSPDGKMLATVNADDDVVKFWDLASGAELFTLGSSEWPPITQGVNLSPDGLAFSSNGLVAISLTTFQQSLGQIQIWDTAARRKVQTLSLDFPPYSPPAFSPDGSQLASRVGIHGAVWDVASGKKLFDFSQDRTVNFVRYSSDGRRLLVAGGGGVAEVFDAETGNKLLSLLGNAGRDAVVAGSPECVKPPEAPFAWCTPRLASAGDDDVIRIWDISPAGQQELLKLPGDDFALSADGTRLNTVTYNMIPAEGAGFATIEQRALLAGPDSDPAAGHVSSSFEFPKGYHDWSFFPQDGILAMPIDNGPIRLWDVTQGGKPVYPISCCVWSQDMLLSFSSRLHPRLAIAHTATGGVIVWDLAADSLLRTLQVVPPNAPTSLALYSVNLSPDGERLVTLNSNTTLEIWDVMTGRKLLTLPGPSGSDGSEIDYSPDGKLLLVTDCSGTQVVRDAITGAEIRRFSKRGCTAGAGFSPDNRFLALRGPETKIFSLETGQEMLALPVRGGPVLFTPDGSRLIAGADEALTGESTVNVFLVHLSDLVTLAKARVTRSLTTAECQEYLHVDACPAGN